MLRAKNIVSFQIVLLVAILASGFVPQISGATNNNTSPTIQVTTITDSESAHSSPFNFVCPANPLFNPINVSGNGAGSAPPGNIQDYHVQIDWGDGVVENQIPATFSPATGHANFTFSYNSPAHSYSSNGNKTIKVRLYHSQPPGNDSQADASISILLCVHVPPSTSGSITVTKIVDGGIAQVGDFTLKVGDTAVTSGVVADFLAGIYAISETGGPDGYSPSFSGDCASGSITVVAPNHYDCTIKNTFAPPPPPTDMCPNIDGVQEQIPDGLIVVDGNCVTPPPENTDANIVATKIVCSSETDLPNWGLGGPDITSNTAADFLAAHSACHLEPGWNFQWAPSGAIDPGKAFIGEAGSPWTTFGPTDLSGVAITTIDTLSLGGVAWMREVLKDGFIPFTFDNDNPSNDSNVSAEIYCSTDVINYDNLDLIDSPQAGQTYYCVAFNALTPAPVTDVCPNLEGAQATVPDGYSLVDGQCVQNTPPPAPQCSDGNDNDQDGLVDAADPGCHTDGDANNISTWDKNDNDETDPAVQPTDVCPNIDGNQAQVPEGKVLSDGQCVDASNNNNGGGNTGGGDSSTSSGSSGGGNGPILTLSAPGNGPIAQGQVLGASTSCGIYLNEYIKSGGKNNPEEVKKLQTFINRHEGANLQITGFYGSETNKAVRELQAKYWEEILRPWVAHGLATEHTTTGYVYKTTKRWINNANCPTLNLPQPELP